MTVAAWIAISALVLLYGSMIIGFWMNVKVKLNELDMKNKNLDIKIMNVQKDLDEHIVRAKEAKETLDGHVDECFAEIKVNQKEMVGKIDTLIENFNKFQIYVEKNFKK